MTIQIRNYSFEGPYPSTEYLEDRSGVYVVLCRKLQKNYIIDVGESAQVKSRVEKHGRKSCWQRNCFGSLAVAVLYTPNKQQTWRKLIEQKIRKAFSAPCGVR